MPTLFLSPRQAEDSAAMAEAASRSGWSVARLGRWRDAEALSASDIAVYGEHMFAEYVAQMCHLALLQPPLDFTARLPLKYRLREMLFTTLDVARQHVGPAFFKPADDKCFPAREYASGANLPGPEILPDDTPVLIVDPVEWEVEYRCFVLDRSISTLSIYLRKGELARSIEGHWEEHAFERTQAQVFAESLLDDPAISLPPAFVLDVGKIRGAGWAVVEANPAWGAGIYGCDPAQALPVVARACVPRAALSDEDAQRADDRERSWVSDG